MAKKPKHIHRYERTKLGKNYIIYKCNLPDCTHYVRKELVRGKLSICNRCNNPMVMGPLQMTLAKPHCLECVKPRGGYELDKVRELVELLPMPD